MGIFTRLSTLAGRVMPTIRAKTQFQNDNVVIGLATVEIAELEALPADDNLVHIHASVLILIATSITTLQLRLKRDGVQLTTLGVYQMLASQVGAFTIHAHWVDTAGGKNPVYALDGVGTGTTPGPEVRERRLTASF